LRYPQPYKKTKKNKSKLNITPNATLWRDNNNKAEIRLKSSAIADKLTKKLYGVIFMGHLV